MNPFQEDEFTERRLAKQRERIAEVGVTQWLSEQTAVERERNKNEQQALPLATDSGVSA